MRVAVGTRPGETVPIGENYFDHIELDDATKDAIATLAGVHPDLDDHDEQEPNDEAVARLVCLVNTIQLFHGHKFEETAPASFADLMSIGEYLGDAVNLATGTDLPTGHMTAHATGSI